ncbi:hypothetical protein [Sphingomonas astaxanthinifaciens]|uniref:YtxH-like protein n=1 Tax=Sphingomonas astaxanthinifaciens DSM 22298 TaxID=1123267 RepID=A0ABQ5Z2A5_9SPHN|nr:hypothetical protein [Sphingomonas astaxanthinifaciens]GLR46888.1 hypothetical protein GCM10007925_05990 [Sphingomonas astaxanthinifaciens DSM 22298]
MAKTDAYQNNHETAPQASGLADRFAGLGDSAASQIDNSPLIALGAGLALGAVLGAVLPASRKERELLQPLGSKITEAGSGALDRGRGMAKQKFDEMAGDKLREFLGASSTTSNA